MAMIKARIAFVVAPDGSWFATGGNDQDDDFDDLVDGLWDPEYGEKRYWLSVEVPLPDKVEPAELAPADVDPA